MVEMLKQVPCFTDVEPPLSKMSDFFPFTKWVSINLGNTPPISVSARLSLGTPESAVSCIEPMQGYTAEQTAKVVSHASFFFV